MAQVTSAATIVINKREEFPRNSARCGYLSGFQMTALDCAGYGDAACRWDQDNSVAGCCSVSFKPSGGVMVVADEAGINCDFFTTCLDFQSSDYSPDIAVADSARTLLCTNGERPHCGIFTYVDVGYSMYTCAESHTTMTAAYDYSVSVPYLDLAYAGTTLTFFRSGLDDYRPTPSSPYATSFGLCQPSASTPLSTDCTADIRAARKASLQDRAVVASAIVFMVLYLATICAVLMGKRRRRNNPRWRTVRDTDDKMVTGGANDREEHLLVPAPTNTDFVELSELSNGCRAQRRDDSTPSGGRRLLSFDD